tara:strand:- start:1215 stop:1469 length:255 start_codon:yes stop_codon:yes gene_type:complete
MLIPVRCFTCNKVLGNKENSIKKYQDEGMEMKEIMEKLKIQRYCCKRVILTHINTCDDLFINQHPPDRVTSYTGVKDIRIYEGL